MITFIKPFKSNFQFLDDLVVKVYPNPFNALVNFEFEISGRRFVDIAIYNVNGKLVKTISDGISYTSGTHKKTWDAAGYSSGVYILKIEAEETLTSRKILLLK